MNCVRLHFPTLSAIIEREFVKIKKQVGSFRNCSVRASTGLQFRITSEAYECM
jgi:hypothetical protein